MANYKFIGGDGKEYGPYSAEQMRQFLSENRLVANSQVSADVPELCLGCRYKGVSQKGVS